MSKIDSILENPAFALVTNKEALEKLDEEQLDALLALAGQEQDPPQDNQDGDKEKHPEEEETPSAMEEFKTLLSGFLKRLETLEAALSANQNAEKNALVAELAGNAKLGLDEEQLDKLDVAALKTLRKSVKPRNYSGQAGGVQDNGGDIKPMKSRSVLLRKESE